MSKVAIICGAGSTLCDAVGGKKSEKPPLDSGFFKICKGLKIGEFKEVSDYIQDVYGIDVCANSEDSLERVMAILYSDLLNPAVATPEAATAFRAYLKLINRRITETTSRINPSQKSYLYRMIRSLIHDHSIAPSDISLITFNYDLHIERTLYAL